MRSIVAPFLASLLGLCVVATSVADGASAATLHRPHHVYTPCEFFTATDVERFTTWPSVRKSKRSYDIESAVGQMCLYESTQGTIIVFLPDLGSPYPGSSPFTQGSAEKFVRPELGVDVTFYSGTDYLTLGKRDIAVRVVPMDHPASFFEVEPFVQLIIKHARKLTAGT